MFVYYFAQIDRPREMVEGAVLDMLQGLGNLAEEAYREGERLHMRVGPAPHVLSKEIELTVIGSPHRWENETWIPIRWKASGMTSLFPRLEADLVIAAIGTDLTQLALRGSYIAPFGGVGRVVDGVLLHRIAEATVKMFVERLADAVRSALGEPPIVPAAAADGGTV